MESKFIEPLINWCSDNLSNVYVNQKNNNQSNINPKTLKFSEKLNQSLVMQQNLVFFVY